MQRFVRNLLKDIQALESMLADDRLEHAPQRIGAEQEICLIDRATFKPYPIATQVLQRMEGHPWVETELANFNLEINLDPARFEGSCLSEMENSLQSKLHIIQKHLQEFNADLIITGILPTIRKYDLELHNLTPRQRYRALIDAINSQLIGHAYELRLRGIDELLVKHDSPLLEACNTSFQVHLQIPPQEFVPFYNAAQALAAPIIAIGANSPIVFGRRLWHESRIALFQQALDVRTTQEHMRERSPRVSFGTDWLRNSIMDIYKEDISRFRILIGSDSEEDSLQLLRQNIIPHLRALQIHNSTVYRWNRPCYGISDTGLPHLRIENRVLPAGPTVVDEMANAALWLGAMTTYGRSEPNIPNKMGWEDARDNFGKAAQFGIDSKFTWFDDRKITACDLIQTEIIPAARAGLEERGIDVADIDRYLGIIEERAKRHTNGARWQIRTYGKLKKESSNDEALCVLTSSMLRYQRESKPIHEWPVPELSDLTDYRPAKLKVDEFMQTDLLTVQKDDLLELVAQLMDWRKIRYVPVEDSKGKLSGLISSRLILRHFARPISWNEKRGKTVKDIMITDPLTIDPAASIMEALRIMQQHEIGCLPVTKGGELIGVITEVDFLRITARLMERLA